jgi:colanic acid biosynthesis glycosyl transferase WcaI
MHMLFLTDNFPPEGNAPASRTYEHAREWVIQGHKITVITCAPNFPEGKIFRGYQNKWLSKEKVDDITVWRVKTYITANEGFVKRTLDYITFMFSSFFFGLFTKDVDVVVGTSPQFFTVISAWALGKVKRVPFVFELRDIWPASITAVGAMEKNLVITLLEKLEMFLYHQADHIITVTNSFKSELIKRGVGSKKIDVVLNGVDLSIYAPTITKDIELASRYGLNGKFVVGYVGTHGLAHALEYVLEAAKLIRENTNIVFLFAGGGAYKKTLENLIDQAGLDNVVSISRQPKAVMPRIWSLCDVAVISLNNSPLFKTVIPSKIFEAMGMGLPMIISVPDGEATDIIKTHNCGIQVTPEMPEEIASAVTKLFADKKLTQLYAENSVIAASHFERTNLAKKFIEILKEKVV